MPKFLADENFDGRAVREIKRLLTQVDIVRVQDISLQGVKDELILAWAAEHGYVLLTHDVRTMAPFGRDRITNGLLFSGMIVVKRTTPLGRIIRELEILITCTREDEWKNYIWFIPL